MRSSFQFTLTSLLGTMLAASLILAASAGAFGEMVQFMVFGTAAYMLLALLILGTYILIAAIFLGPLILLFWAFERCRSAQTTRVSSPTRQDETLS